MLCCWQNVAVDRSHPFQLRNDLSKTFVRLCAEEQIPLERFMVKGCMDAWDALILVAEANVASGFEYIRVRNLMPWVQMSLMGW